MLYSPIDTLKGVSEDVWIVDGALIRFGPPLLKIPFPTRMTVIRQANGDLFIHSPTALPTSLKAEIDGIGQPRWIIAPNRLHYWWTPDWKAAFPEATVYLAPRIGEQAGGRIAFAHLPLRCCETDYPWNGPIATLSVEGGYMSEFVFFHRPSRTLLLTDLIENFEAWRLPLLLRVLARLGGVLDPNGSTPRDLRLTFASRRAELRRAVELMISWKPERVILAHGRWYERDGTLELERAFGWILN